MLSLSSCVRLAPPPVDRPDDRANAFTTRLGRFVELDHEEISALDQIARHPRRYRAGEILFHEGSHPQHVCLIQEGFALRYKCSRDGKRQILGYLIEGDICDAHFTIFNKCDHSVQLLTDALIVQIPTQVLMETIVRYPRIERAILLTTLVEKAMLREWLLNVAQRDACQKLAHFFCEMAARLTAVGLANDDGSISLPLTQRELADTVGLTTVHANRTLQRLRSDGLITLTHRRLTILDPDRLCELADFNQDYLRIDDRPLELAFRSFG